MPEPSRRATLSLGSTRDPLTATGTGVGREVRRPAPGRNETLAMLSAVMALMAMAIDLMLSAFDEMRVTLTRPHL